jgi:hypothetical protein
MNWAASVGPPTLNSPENSARSGASTSPTSPLTSRLFPSTRARLVEKTIFGVAFQTRALSRQR